MVRLSAAMRAALEAIVAGRSWGEALRAVGHNASVSTGRALRRRKLVTWSRERCVYEATDAGRTAVFRIG